MPACSRGLLIAVVSGLTFCQFACGQPSVAGGEGHESQRLHGTDKYGDPLPSGAIARFGTVRLRHEGIVTFAAFSPDGKTLASGGYDCLIRLWERTTGKEIGRLVGYQNTVYTVAFSPDGKVLATGGRESEIRLWDVATCRELRAKGHERYVNSLAFSPDGKTLASGSDDRTIRLWEVASGKEVRQLGGGRSPVDCVAFSADGRSWPQPMPTTPRSIRGR